MRRAARVDDNHTAIVDALRRAGCSVRSLASLDKGCPDLLVGRAGVNYLRLQGGFEPSCKRRLTPDEEAFHAHWRGPVAVVESVEDALKAVGVR